MCRLGSAKEWLSLKYRAVGFFVDHQVVMVNAKVEISYMKDKLIQKYK